MRYLLSTFVVLMALSSLGCVVEVKDKPAPVITPERDVDIKVKTPAVDVKVDK